MHEKLKKIKLLIHLRHKIKNNRHNSTPTVTSRFLKRMTNYKSLFGSLLLTGFFFYKEQISLSRS